MPGQVLDEDENVGGEVGDDRAGRLVAPDEGAHGDTEKDLVADDIGIDEGAAGAEEAAVNAYLLARDALIGPLSARDRRLVLGAARGTAQKTLAEQESISQSAVSQALRRASAGALLTGARLFEDAC